MRSDFPLKEKYGFDDLVKIMRVLRGPGGCPWDAEQTHASIRKNFIEETYEAIEAIDAQDPVLLQEELGDVLLQVIYHAAMEEEQGNFSIDDVCDGVCKKLVIRHPHIFGALQLGDDQAAGKGTEDRNGNTEKRAESPSGADAGGKDPKEGVPRGNGL